MKNIKNIIEITGISYCAAAVIFSLLDVVTDKIEFNGPTGLLLFGQTFLIALFISLIGNRNLENKLLKMALEFSSIVFVVIFLSSNILHLYTLDEETKRLILIIMFGAYVSTYLMLLILNKQATNAINETLKKKRSNNE